MKSIPPSPHTDRLGRGQQKGDAVGRGSWMEIGLVSVAHRRDVYAPVRALFR